MNDVDLSTCKRVLVVEDDAGMRSLLARELSELGLEVGSVASAEEAIAKLDDLHPSIIVSDLRLPKMDGIELLECTRRTSSPPGFIIITAFGAISQAVEALRKGADDFLTKPLDLEHLSLRVQRLVELQQLKQEVRHHRGANTFHGMVGRSRIMRELFSDIRRVAQARGPILITGESGVGKELVAKAIHRESTRRDGPFVAVNCAGIPDELMESELFGHESGSFTGATRSRAGLFSEAEGGTILLDEVGELKFSMQAKLLRVLQDGAVRRVGANREKVFDVRVLVATNRDLEEEVARGTFREDLFYRLATFILDVPPLRERGNDIEVLASHFFARHLGASGAPGAVDPEVLDCLRGYSFPGNARELESVVEYAVTFADGGRVTCTHLPERVKNGRPEPLGGEPEDTPRMFPTRLTDDGLLTLDDLTSRYVRHVLDLVGGNKRRAAALLGISRQTLYRHLERSRS